MAQYDGHRNKGALRVVVPLVRRNVLPSKTPTVGSRMNPTFKTKGLTSPSLMAKRISSVLL